MQQFNVSVVAQRSNPLKIKLGKINIIFVKDSFCTSLTI